MSDDSDLDQGTAETVVGNGWILDVFGRQSLHLGFACGLDVRCER